MVDDVIAWKLPISTMPNEIRWIIRQFME
jgi:hypothetical protein